MFEVKHDASRPFIVETFACDAEVLGTKFNILAAARTADFSAALLEGRLKILNRLGGGESFILSPNEQIDLGDGHLKLNRITDPDDFRWVDGLMNLNTLSFGEVIRKFENYYGVRITIDNPEDMPVLDRWLLTKLNELIEKAEQSYCDYEFQIITHAVNDFCVNTLSSF